jgi:hypothetical protein
VSTENAEDQSEDQNSFIAVQLCTAFDSHLQKHTCAFSGDPYNGFTGADLGADFLI